MGIQVAVVSPERELWAGEAEFVRARAEGGDMGILPGHAPFLGSLHDAPLVIDTGSEQIFVAVHRGFIQVMDDRVNVLTQRGELASEIDTERARRQKEEAERRIADEDTHENRERLLRAVTRIKTAAEAGILDI